MKYSENMTAEEKEGIPYNSISGSIWFVYYELLMANQNIDTFGKGYHLFDMFMFASFIMIVVLLNMLIAIMGNTFAERSAVFE